MKNKIIPILIILLITFSITNYKYSIELIEKAQEIDRLNSTVENQRKEVNIYQAILTELENEKNNEIEERNKRLEEI